VHQYLGIPYAVPPVGDLRWTAPALLDQPNAQVEATRLPPSCMQFLTNQGNSLYVRDVLEFNLQGLNRTGNITEDCLTLSVWTPSNATSGHAEHGGRHHGQPNHSNTNNNNNSSQGLPVLIFIYGGSFQTGGQDVPYQIPAQWVNRTADHIVVSFNYRVNIFGFPNAGGLEEQNLGLLDQRAAVEWCRQNIAAFGGDPARMVLWGQSAGSISVDYYNFAYPSDPIVTGLIMNSGTANSPTSVNDTTHANFTFVAEHVGCAGLGGDAAQQLACMRGVNANTIEDFLATYQEGGNTPALSFDPVVDGKIIFQNYTERARASQQAKIVSLPLLISTTAYAIALTSQIARHNRHRRPRRRPLRALQPLRSRPSRGPPSPPPHLLLPGHPIHPPPARNLSPDVPLPLRRQLHQRLTPALDGRLPRRRAADAHGHAPGLPRAELGIGVRDQPGLSGRVRGVCEGSGEWVKGAGLGAVFAIGE